MPTKKEEYLVNESIRFPKVLVIDSEGNALGVKDRREALQLAKEANLDLFCLNPNGTPPVCKILDFGKHRYSPAGRADQPSGFESHRVAGRISGEV